MMRLQFDERQYKLTLPKKLVEALGWKKGDEITVEIESTGSIILKNPSQEKEAKIQYAR